MSDSLPSSPTPPDAPTPGQIVSLRSLTLAFEGSPDFFLSINRDEAAALASLLRAYEGMRADAERLDWLQGDGEYYPVVDFFKGGWDIAFRIPGDSLTHHSAGTTLREAIDAARASAPDRAPENANG